ncbi:hypothetical protein BHM03_00030097 [Ensete ventricosum]|nr:hypothetical protein BHM03_00030097 [Ensete ventricosum]
MASEIEVVDDVIGIGGGAPVPAGGGGGAEGDEALKNDVYTAAAYGDLEKLQRLVEAEGCSVSEPDGAGYYALQWAALNNRTAAALYIIEVSSPPPLGVKLGVFLWVGCSLQWLLILRGHIQVAELLLKEGARVDASDLYGYQGNARRVFDRPCNGNSHLGKLSKLGLAPALCAVGWCLVSMKDPGFINRNVRDAQSLRDDEPLLKTDLNHPALLAGNWSQLCATCKVLLCPYEETFFSLCYLILGISDLNLIEIMFRLSGQYVQNIVPLVTVVSSSLIITVLGYQIVLARFS